MNTEERNILLKAIENRHSVRRYRPEQLDTETIALLNSKIKELNRTGCLHMQLVNDEPKAFNGLMAYGKFSGVRNYVIVAGEKNDSFEERVGYYGEQLVLYAQSIGLNTCWAGLSYKKIDGTYQLEENEKISCYIALGYGETQGSSHKCKSVEDVSNVSVNTPEWFKDGVKAALLAPTAINQQKFFFEYIAPDAPGKKAKVRGKKGFSMVGYTKIDLGIAKLHFEIGADPDNFSWASH